MNTPRRDVGLDVLKGLGCALMVLAHSSIVLKTDDVFSYIGGFAPIMFFTVSGVTATFQAAKYNFRSVFWPYLFLLVLGYSYNALGYTNFLLDPDYQILQVIAFSAVVVYLAERYFHPVPWVYFILAVLTFLVKAFVAWYPPTQNVPVLSGTILPMGYFPIIPWLALFFLGVFAYRIPNSNNLWLALTLIFVYVTLDLIGVNLDPLNKWSLSLGYFLICCISTLLAFFAVRGFAWFQSEHGKGWILFFGRNSLLFLYVHLGLINTAYYFKWFSKIKWLPHAPYVLWIGVTIATILLMWMLLPMSRIERIARFFRWLPIWIFLSVMVFLVPMLIHRIEIVFAMELSIGILLSLYYHALAGIFRPRFAGFFQVWVKVKTMLQIIPTAEPFFIPGKSDKLGCLLIHGFTGTPKEMRWMGGFLAEQGYSTLGIRLAGHATHPRDMIRTRYTDWLASVEDGYRLLRGSVEQVVLIGLSMGGVLSLIASTQFETVGVIAMSTPFELVKDWRLGFIDLLSLVEPYMPKGKQIPGAGWFDSEAWKDHVSYPENPVRSIGELNRLLRELREALPEVYVPTLLIHSKDDGYVLPENAEKIFNALGTRDKELVWVTRSGHVVTRDAARHHVFDTALKFIHRIEGLA